MFMEIIIAYRNLFGSDTLMTKLGLGMSGRGDTLDLLTSELPQQVLELSHLWSQGSFPSKKVNQDGHIILVLKLFVVK